jgi:agmatine deiminase
VTRLLDSTPRDDGYRMPGEYEPHAGTWLLWPQRPDVWRLGGKPAQRAFVALAAAIARFEPVTVGVNHDQFDNARSRLPDDVRVLEISSDDAWLRDSGPSFVVNDCGGVRLVDWHFNSHGRYLPTWEKDDRVARKIAEIEGVDRYRAPLVLEGGSIHVDGEGTVLTTEECLLNPNRNPDLSREQIERHLCDYLGASTVVWLGRGLDPDVTSGHVDDVATFVRPGVVALAWSEDPADWRREILAENLRRLERVTDARGRRLEVHKIQLPEDVLLTEDEAAGIDMIDGAQPMPPGFRQAATYVNCYLCNGGVIMPTFDDPKDDQAREALQGLFPGREVVPLPSHEIILAGGNVHCVTQQQPRAKGETT